MIRVVDKATGELMEFDYKDDADLAQQYWELGKEIDAKKRAREKMRDVILQMMDDQTSYEAGRWLFRRQHRTYTEYDKAALKRHLDADQLDLVLKPDKKATKELIARLGEEKALGADALADIKDSMLVTRGVEALTVEPPTERRK